MNIRNKRKILTIKEKKEAIRLSKQGYSHKVIGEKLGAGRSTITKVLLKNKMVIPNNNEDKIHAISNGLDDLENKILLWCVDENVGHTGKYTVKRGITKEDIIKQAQLLAYDMNLKFFKDAITWFTKFNKKYDLKFDNINEHKIVINSNDIIVTSNIPTNYNLNYSTILPNYKPMNPNFTYSDEINNIYSINEKDASSPLNFIYNSETMFHSYVNRPFLSTSTFYSSPFQNPFYNTNISGTGSNTY